MDDGDRREAAIKRLKRKREFWNHLFVYIVINGMLVGIWAMSSADYFWPIWSIGGWGIGLVFHAFDKIFDVNQVIETEVAPQSAGKKIAGEREVGNLYLATSSVHES